jgi:SWIRM domain
VGVQAEQEVDPNFREEISEGVVRRHVRFINKKVKEGVALSENLSWGQMAKVYDAADACAEMARVHVPRPVTDARAPPADAHVRMPVYAHWFRMESIHEIERNGNVEFFNGRSSLKTPEVYVALRNFMVQHYRSQPQQRLTLLDCRRHLVGDVNAIRRIWSFLDSWGLINFEADPEPVRVAACCQSGASACCLVELELCWISPLC